MCHCRCLHENYDGDCTARAIDGLLPCDDGYAEAADYDSYLADEAADLNAEYMRERRDEEEEHYA